MKGRGITERSAGLVIYKAGPPTEFLLLWHGGEYWNFPKGHVESGETPLVAALREAAEEAGLSGLAVHPTFAETIHYTFNINDRKILKDATFYLAQFNGGEVRTSYEHSGFGWFEYEKALKRLRYHESCGALKKAQEALETEGFSSDGD